MGFIYPVLLLLMFLVIIGNILKRWRKYSVKQLCVKCNSSMEVRSAEDVKAGDHVYFPRHIFGRKCYEHHALVSKVYDQREGEHVLKVRIIHVNSREKVLIEECDLEVDLKKEKVFVVIYKTEVYSPQERVDRAYFYLKQGQGTILNFNYSLSKNNCEHFVINCVTGLNISLQTEDWKTFFTCTFEEEWLVRAHNYKFICDACYTKMMRLLKAQRTHVIQTLDEYQVGDILTYKFSKNDTRHQAVIVVIDNEKRSECTIVHYDTANKKIVETKFTVRTGKTELTKFDETKVLINWPEDVCARARQRVGEQIILPYKINSISFAGWCALSDIQPHIVSDFLTDYFVFPIMITMKYALQRQFVLKLLSVVLNTFIVWVYFGNVVTLIAFLIFLFEYVRNKTTKATFALNAIFFLISIMW